MQYCGACGKEASDEALFCRACGAKLVGTADPQTHLTNTKNAMNTIIGKNCPYCQTPIKPGAEAIACPSCEIVHHSDCWKANGNKCTTFGCNGMEQIVTPEPTNSPIVPALCNTDPPPGVDKNVGHRTKKWKKIGAAAIVLLMIAGGAVYAKYNTTDTVVLPDGSKYTGEIRWGKITGNGTMVYSNGRTYKGQFKEGISQGTGTMVLTDGTRYEGNVIDGKRQGNGKYYNASQQLIHEGTWFNDERNGQGFQIMPDGTQYIGMFANNKREGEGKLHSRSGQAIYDGTWQNDEKHGTCKMWFDDGTRYEGQIKTGRRHGQGKLFSSSGKLTYEGEWADDLKHGQGTMVADDGSVLRGSWYNGAYVPPQVAQAPAPPQRRESQPPPSQQKRGDPTPQDIFGAFLNIINQIEKK